MSARVRVRHPARPAPRKSSRHLLIVIQETGLRARDACTMGFNPVIPDSAGWPCMKYYNTKMATEQLIPLSRRSDQGSLAWAAGRPRESGHRRRNQHTRAGLQAAAPAVLEVLCDAAGPGDVELTVEVSLKDPCHLVTTGNTSASIEHHVSPHGALPVSVASPPARELDQGPNSDLGWAEEVWVRAT